MSRQRSPAWKTRAIVASDGEITVDEFGLEVIDGPGKGLKAASEGLELSVGTAPGSTLLLTDPSVSRHHCTIMATPQGFLIRDLGSTNGTRVGGIRIEQAYLEPGAVVSIGETTAKFDCTGEQIRQPLAREESFGGVLGSSTAMRRVFAMMEKVAKTDATVLLTGETGTGKGALTEALHQQSLRAEKPLVVVDCGAIPEKLIESELFGHEKGAFTGADRQRIGSFEAADGGTLFLDELGELSLDLQPKLLRVLENREIRRLGSTQAIPIDVRIVAATNRDLREEVNAGSFRSDLYYRLNVMRIEIPPLRDRPEDIPALAAHFFRQLSGDPAAAPGQAMISRFLRQKWPGNVRELRAAVERIVVLGDLASVSRLAPGTAQGAAELDFSITYREAKEQAVLAWEAQYVPELLRRYEGNLSRAARAVSMDRNHLRKLLRRFEDSE